LSEAIGVRCCCSRADIGPDRATVWGGRIWLRNSETLVFAGGAPNSPETRFATKLAAMLKNNSSRLRLKIAPNADNAKALAQFERKQADLAVLRTMPRCRPALARWRSWNMTCCC